MPPFTRYHQIAKHFDIEYADVLHVSDLLAWKHRRDNLCWHIIASNNIVRHIHGSDIVQAVSDLNIEVMGKSDVVKAGLLKSPATWSPNGDPTLTQVRRALTGSERANAPL